MEITGLPLAFLSNMTHMNIWTSVKLKLTPQTIFTFNCSIWSNLVVILIKPGLHLDILVKSN